MLTAGSLVWAVWEVGLDWWALAPRGGLIVVLGIVLLTALFFRRAPRHVHAWRASGAALGASLVAAIALAVGAMMNDPHRVQGSVPEAEAATLTPSADQPASPDSTATKAASYTTSWDIIIAR